jgi:uncharacterized damage-inducible protein DinB
MKSNLPLIGILLLIGCSSQPDSSLKPLLLDKLKSSYDNEAWFAPLKKATTGLTAEQANWKDSTGNHSIGQLVSHLIFWNERNLMAFQGNTPPDFTGNNEETFDKFTTSKWEDALAKLDSIHASLNETVEKGTPEQIEQWSSDLANIASHNAYHTGQIVYIRKMRGWW